MYVGHFAIGLAIKAARPRTPTLPIMWGVGFLDIVNGILIVLGLDRVTPNLASGPYLFFDLTFVDWDHWSLSREFWGKGYATEAALAVQTMAFSDARARSPD